MFKRTHVLGDVVVSVLAISPKCCQFKPDRGRYIFNGNKKSVARLPSEESKAEGPMS
jgi:hypothetical protein